MNGDDGPIKGNMTRNQSNTESWSLMDEYIFLLVLISGTTFIGLTVFLYGAYGTTI